MQSKVSWFKRGIIAQDLRTVGWIGIIYQIALLFALPLQLIMMHEADRLPYSYVKAQNLFSILPGFQILLMFTVPLILSVVLFRYLQVKVSADFIHSLPIKRAALFNLHTLMGLLLLIVPVVITAIFITIVHGVLGLEHYFTGIEIVKWAGITILMNIFVFSLATLIGTVTGISAVQVVLTYIFLIFPAGIMILLYFNLKYFIYGFAYDYYFNQNIELLSPIIRMVALDRWNVTATEVLVYIALTVVFYLLGLFAYQKRHIEGATQAIAFRFLKPIFKYGVTFCTMLLGGMYFGETQREAFGWIIFGYFFGSILGYVIAEMVLQKTWRIFKSMKGYVVYGVVAIVIGFLLNLDITGYEKKLPAAAEIERAYFGDSVHWLNKKYVETIDYGMPVAEYDKAYPVNAIKEADRYYFTDPESMNTIMKLHQQLVMDKKTDFNNERFYKNIAIAYELKNGSTLVRQYRIPENAYHEFLKPIYESQEYRYSNNELLRLKEEITIDKIRINSNSAIVKNFETVDPKQIEEIINVLKTDMLQEPYEEMFNDRETWGDIEILLENNQRLHVPWKRSYVQFDKWLKDNHLQEKARIVAKDIDYMLVARNQGAVEAPVKMIEDTGALFKDNTATLKVEDPKQIEECLYETSWQMEAEYVIAIYYKNAEFPEYRGLEKAPAFVQEYFK